MRKVKKTTRTKLYRGDSRAGVAVPDPGSKTPVVAHVLYLGGAGRSTPFSSVSGRREAASHFAGTRGKVWETDSATALAMNARHIENLQLMADLRGVGKGICRGPNAVSVASARVYVERWNEHLLHWCDVDQANIGAAIAKSFA